MATQGKTYTPLSEHPEIKITKCSEILANRMQCWRAGDYQITTITLTPTETDPNAVTIVDYQKCRRHAQAEKDADDAVNTIATIDEAIAVTKASATAKEADLKKAEVSTESVKEKLAK